MRWAAVLVAALVVAVPASARRAAAGNDWPLFGFTPARGNASDAATRITAATAAKLVRQQVAVGGTVDSSPIYLHDVRVRGGTHDVFFVTTTYGRTVAVDAANGRVLWTFTPPAYSSYAGSYRITNMSPAADPSRTAIYAGAPDGRIRKLRVADGRVVWSTAITRLPEREKLTSSLNVARGLVIAATGGYIGDAPPYQGHVVTLRTSNGRVVHVWNSLCSNRHALISPPMCSASDSAIWGRSGAVVDPVSGDLLVATGNGPWNGSTNWGDSTLVLSPDASRLLRHWSPTNVDELEQTDADLGSTAPALVGRDYAVQGGKDGKLRLLAWRRLPGTNAVKGGELQTVPTAGGLFSAPAVWRGKWIFVATEGALDAWVLRGARLQKAWSASGGASPVVAGGLLYVAGGGNLRILAPTTGHELASLELGDVHWQSPIVADGRVAVATGNANDHLREGYLSIYRRR